MRTKISIFGLCFLATMVFVAYTGTPRVAEALRNLGQGLQEDGNETEPPDYTETAFGVPVVTCQHEIVWEKRYRDWEAEDMIPAGDGFLILGNILKGVINLRALMIDADGDKIWSRTYGGAYEVEKAGGLVGGENGTYLLAGGTDSWGAGERERKIL